LDIGKDMDYIKLREEWLAEENAFFQGWDFSRNKDTWKENPLKWDYVKTVQKYLKSDDLLLDMGTGGGEVLLTIKHPYNLTYVTEAYPPNVELCQKTLSPLGIHVEQVYGDYNDNLPFDDEMFDIIINRHESFDMKEVNRILKPNGLFITQQVGCENSLKLKRAFIPDYKFPLSDFTLDNNLNIIKNHGCDIILKDECFPEVRIYDVKAIIYYLKAILWEIPDFSVERYFPQLLELHKKIKSNGFFENASHRFIIVARKIN